MRTKCFWMVLLATLQVPVLATSGRAYVTTAAPVSHDPDGSNALLDGQAGDLAFGPKRYVRTTGRPDTFTESFQHCGAGTCRIVVVNGNPDGTHRASVAVISVNGVQVVGPNDLNQQVAEVTRPVVLATDNKLTIVLASAPGSFVTVSVECAGAAALSAGAQGVNVPNPTTLLAALGIVNDGTAPAENVTVTSITLSNGALTAPALPANLGTIAVNGAAVLNATFSGGPFLPGASYDLAVGGTFNVGASTFCFSLHEPLVVPPAAPGFADLGNVNIEAHHVSGAPFPPRPPDFEEDERNGQRWVAPTGPFVPGGPPPGVTSVNPPPAEALKTGEQGGAPIVFTGNHPAGINGNTISEPSGASGGGVVFLTANTFAAYSTNGGTSFTQLNPTAIFPNDAVGFCCDQIVQYVPSIDRFVWFLQGTGYRLAVASPADIINSGGTAWTYWNLTPQVFGQPNGTGFDYPEVAVGNNSIYMSWDAGFGCPAGCNWGFQVARTSVAGLQAGGTITIEFTDPSKGRMAWGSHVTQDTGDEVFWAGHNSNSNMRVFSLREGSNTYFWRDRGISSWANNGLTSLTPDNQNWMSECGGGFPGNNVIGATRQFNRVWFAWAAGTDDFFQRAHVEMVAFDRSDDFSVDERVQIWNNSYAFGYPALATNACSGEVGLSLEYGGNGNYENHVVGIWGDFLVYLTTASNVGTCRFGDYVTIRQRPPSSDNPGNLFDAFGYGLNSSPGSGTQTDIRYVTFGRPASFCQSPPRVSLRGSTTPDVVVSAPEPELEFTGISPNPVARDVTIGFLLPSRERVRASLYDLQGRRVSILLDEVRDAGPQMIRWTRGSGSGLRSGMYVLSLSTERGAVTRRVVVLE